MMVAVGVQDVTFYYSSHQALDGIAINVDKGDFVGIIGPNGSGKSTLLKVISGVLKPQKGIVNIKSELLKNIKRKDIAKFLAVVPQDSSAGFNFKVSDIVMMGRYPHQKRFNDETQDDIIIVNEAMNLTGCYKFKDRFFQELSGGEKQLVILARALAQEPEILLLDEPTSHLDIGFQTEIFDLIFELNRKTNITVIAVLHDLNLASQYCDYLWLMKQGKIYSTGNPDDVLTEENIKQVYSTKVIMERHPVSFRPRITLLPQNSRYASFLGKKMHVIGGGGSASSIISFFAQNGAQVSAGVINIGDTDWETACQLGVTVAEEDPFSPITDKALQKCYNLMVEADVIIVAEVPVGHGNINNIVLAYKMLKMGKTVCLLNSKNWAKRDYTEGKFINILEEMKTHGASIFLNLKELIKYLDNIL